MSDNWTTDVKPGYITQIIREGSDITIIHRPILSDEERARRMEAIKQAAERLIIATERQRRRRATA